MEIRVLNYFLATARTENISRAAEEMNISQPALSRQLMDLEEELGVKLFNRKNRRTTLTDAGYLLKKRAEEITALTEKTVEEISLSRQTVGGNIRIGCGETAGMRIIAQAFGDIRQKYHAVCCRLFSMDGAGVREHLDRGTIDFGVLVLPQPPADYEYIEIDHEDIWGVFMKKNSPLAKRKKIRREDLWELPLIVSRQSFANKELKEWFGKEENELNIVATYTLIYNASLLAEAGVGYLLSLDRLINLTEESILTFRPLTPKSVCRIYFVWKRGQVFSRAAELLREKISEQ